MCLINVVLEQNSVHSSDVYLEASLLLGSVRAELTSELRLLAALQAEVSGQIVFQSVNLAAQMTPVRTFNRQQRIFLTLNHNRHVLFAYNKLIRRWYNLRLDILVSTVRGDRLKLFPCGMFSSADPCPAPQPQLDCWSCQEEEFVKDYKIYDSI